MGSASNPPKMGAMTGASPWMVIMIENARAALRPCAKSETQARASTTHAPLPSPRMNRAAISRLMCVVRAQLADAATDTTAPMTRRRCLPRVSESAPTKSCPNAMPTINVESVSCTRDGVVLRSAAIAGNAGRYMSMAKGPPAASSANAANVPPLSLMRPAG